MRSGVTIVQLDFELKPKAFYSKITINARQAILIFLLIIMAFGLTGTLHSQDPMDKNAITTSLKDAYLSARWVENFERYMKTYSEIRSLKQLSDGLFRIEVISYCLKPGVPVNNSSTYSYVLGPLKGNKADLIKEVIKRSIEHKEIEQKYVQTLLWGILAGFGYSDYPDDFAKRISILLPDEEKSRKSKVNMKDILNLPIPKEVKEQMNVVSDLRRLISEGINRYDEIERISMPQTDPEVSKSDVKIDENCWTLMDNGYYVRPKPGGSRTKLDIYRPEQVSVTYDEKGRVKTMSSPVGILEIEYDDNSGADVITYPSSNSYKINRISGLKLDGEPIGKLWKMLWYSQMDSRTSQTSQYKRKEIGIVTDPLEASFVYRDVKIKNLFEYFDKFNNSIKLSSEDEKELYELKQLEYCMKFVADSMRFQVKEESIEKIIRIATDAAVGKFSEKVKSVSPKGGSQSDGGFGFGFNVAIPGNNAQRIGVTGQGSEEGNDPEVPPITGNEDPPPPTTRDTTRDPVDCRIDLKQVDMNLLPAPNQLFMAWFEIECNRPIQEIRWRLFSVSKENGRYCNDKDPAFYRTEPNPDLSIDPLENDQYEIISDGTGTTATGQRNAPHMIFVKAHDYGAFGRLSLSVKVDGVYYDAVCEGWDNNFINIPYDLNDNKIADKWEMDNGVSMTFADTDAESTSPLHETYGDGMTVYDEYRGFYLFGAEGFNYHKRMDPLKKEMFVIDPSLIVPLIAWKRLTQIEVYRLTPELVYGDLAGGDILQYKWVNFSSGFSAGSKYCLRVENVVGLDDPYGIHPDHHFFGYCTEEIPKRVERTVIFPDRIAKYMRETQNSLALILSESGESETITLRGRAWDRDFVQKTVDWLRNESSFDYFHRFFMDQVVIHEMGHGCSIAHHSAGTGTGHAQCVMRHFYDMEYAESFLFMFYGVAGGLIHNELSSEELMYVFTRAPYVFCSSPDNCFGQININDRTP